MKRGLGSILLLALVTAAGGISPPPPGILNYPLSCVFSLIFTVPNAWCLHLCINVAFIEVHTVGLDEESLLLQYPAELAEFGKVIESTSLNLVSQSLPHSDLPALIFAEPAHGCEIPTNEPLPSLVGSVVVVHRGTCAFTEKVTRITSWSTACQCYLTHYLCANVFAYAQVRVMAAVGAYGVVVINSSPAMFAMGGNDIDM